uniref:POLQ protein n=1 Tax=Fopius arisanus TaxID=64838 RepID=A0A0C9Q746_9HYME
MQSLGENTLAALAQSDDFLSLQTWREPLKESRPNISPKTKDNTSLEAYFNESLVLSRSRYSQETQKQYLTPPRLSKRKKTTRNASPPLETVDPIAPPLPSDNRQSSKEPDQPPQPSSSSRQDPPKNHKTLKKVLKYSTIATSPLWSPPSLTKSLESLESSECSSFKCQNPLASLQDPSPSSRSDLNPQSPVPSLVSTQDRVKLSSWGLPPPILSKYHSRGLHSMFPWQVDCLSIPHLLISSRNLVYSAPTSAGKTLVSEILVIKTVIERQKKVIFILPFVSVVREKMYYFQDLLSDSGVRVEGFMGGVQPPGGITSADVAIATIEKANSLINQMMEAGELENLGAVVIDELHLLGDPFRGYLLELLLTKIKYMTLKVESVKIQLIGMSATLPNLDVLAKWLDAELFRTDFRPVPLKELCKIGATIYDDHLTPQKTLATRPDLPQDPDNILSLCLETLEDGHSVLIFCPTKNWCETLAQQIAKSFCQLGRTETPAGESLRCQLNREMIMDTLEQLKRSPSGLDDVLRSTVSFGVAYHHAGLTMDERDIIEGAFRTGALRVLTATSTLSSGVNLPARRVIIRTIMFHGRPIDTLTYKQMIGRAGRMGKDTAGESILICKPTERTAVKNLLKSTLQPIESCLQSSGPLIRSLLEAVASEVAYTLDDILLYTSCTLLSSTRLQEEVETSTKSAVDFLVDNELLLPQVSESGERRWVATQLGKACLAASVPPKDGLFLFQELEKARKCFVLDTELHVIYLVTPFSSSSLIGQVDWSIFLNIWRGISESDRRVGQLVGVSENFLSRATTGNVKQGKILDIHKRFYTALALHDLVREVPLGVVCRKYSCCRGVIQSLQQTAATFAGMVTQFCKKLGWSCVELLVSQFQARLQFGVSRELLDLLRLPTLNGLRARSLFREGITTVAELAVADEMDVERALHKALPFESEKDSGEGEIDAERRKQMRTIFVTGRDGLTPREAAGLIVKEARAMVQNELGVDGVHWEKKNSRSVVQGSLSTVDDGDVVLRMESGVENLNSVSARNTQSERKIPEVSDCLSRSSRVHGKSSEGSGMTSSMRDVESHEKIGPVPGETAGEIALLPVKNLECTSKPEEASKTPMSLLRTSLAKSSTSRSPSLFGDSLGVDTQEYNVLEQNVIDLDDSVFSDTEISVFKTSGTSKNRNSSKSKPRENSVEFVRPEAPSRPASVADENRSKSLVWDEDSWNNTNGIIETVKKLRTPPQPQKPSKIIPKEKSTLGKIRKTSKRKLSSPGVEKSPIVNVISYNSPGGLSTGSNKSEEDVIVASQNADRTTSMRTRTRMKLESIRIRTQGTALKTQATIPRLMRQQISNSETFVCDDCSVESVVVNSDEETPLKRNNPSRTKIALKTQKGSQEKMGLRALEVIDVTETRITDQRITKTKSYEPSKPKFKKNINLQLEEERVPQERVKKPDFKILKIINITEKEKFTEFKDKLSTKTEISLALACEPYLKDTITIGTKIIGASTLQESGRKTRRIETCVHNDRRLCGVAMSWGDSVYFLSFENSDVNRISMKERMAFLTELLSSRTVIRCFSTKETYKTLFRCCSISPSSGFLDPQVADWLLQSDSPEKTFINMVQEHLPEGLGLLQRLGPLSGPSGPGLNLRSSTSSDLRASTEALLTFWMLQALSKKLEKISKRLLKTFEDVEMGTVVLLARMELTGLGINLEALQRLSSVVQDQLSNIEARAYSLAGRKFNFSSSKSVAGALGMDTTKKVCTNKATLEASNHPIAKLVVNWRKLSSTHMKMIYPLLTLAGKSSRIHGTCVTHTATGRVSMHEPNLQNVPRDFQSIDNDSIISVRMAFVPGTGNVIVSADYCQLELRILAHFSEEERLLEALRRPGDVFRNIAAKWYNKDEEGIDDGMRQRTKQLCYGMIYGMGTRSLAETLQVDEAEARVFMDTFMRSYPGVKAWLADVVEEARKQGFVETLMGRRRCLPGLRSEIPGERGQAERQAVNTKVQGSAADLAKMAMLDVDRRMTRHFQGALVMPEVPAGRKLRSNRDSGLRGGFLVLQLHDELIYEVNQRDLGDVVGIIREGMEGVVGDGIKVPLPVRVKVGTSWGNLEEYQTH